MTSDLNKKSYLLDLAYSKYQSLRTCITADIISEAYNNIDRMEFSLLRLAYNILHDPKPGLKKLKEYIYNDIYLKIYTSQDKYHLKVSLIFIAENQDLINSKQLIIRMVNLNYQQEAAEALALINNSILPLLVIFLYENSNYRIQKYMVTKFGNKVFSKEFLENQIEKLKNTNDKDSQEYITFIQGYLEDDKSLIETSLSSDKEVEVILNQILDSDDESRGQLFLQNFIRLEKSKDYIMQSTEILGLLFLVLMNTSEYINDGNILTLYSVISSNSHIVAWLVKNLPEVIDNNSEILRNYINEQKEVRVSHFIISHYLNDVKLTLELLDEILSLSADNSLSLRVRVEMQLINLFEYFEKSLPEYIIEHAKKTIKSGSPVLRSSYAALLLCNNTRL